MPLGAGLRGPGEIRIGKARPLNHPLAPQGDDTRSRILAAATQLVEERGEAGLRVVEVGEIAGVSTASMYTYFTNRDDLIVAVRLEQYLGEVSADVEFFGEMVRSATSGPDLVQRMREVTKVSAVVDRAPVRWRRAEVLGAARRRPMLAERIAERQREVNDELAQHIREGQERGLIDPSLDALALSVFIQAFSLGLVLADIDPNSKLDRGDWLEVVSRFTSAVTAD